MAAAVVTIVCIAMIVVGGMTLSQGILTSTDSAATSVESISVREGDMMRTDINVSRAAELSWGDDLRVTVKNNGQTKLASYDKWDMIVTYVDGNGVVHSTWLPYTIAALSDNQWQKARIGLDGPIEYFEPGILNPGEEMVILANLLPLPGSATSGDISLTTPNGIYSSLPLVNPGHLRLTPQTENITLYGTKYFELVEAATADGPVLITIAQFENGETGRKLLFDTTVPTRPASFVYPLTGISQIPSETWTVNYRCLVTGTGSFPKTGGDVTFNITIMVRQSDGTIRNTIATGVATAGLQLSDAGSWVTLTGSYVFPGYTVIDANDYLEIAYYGQTTSGPDGGTGILELSIDDSSLPLADQTRVEAL